MPDAPSKMSSDDSINRGFPAQTGDGRDLLLRVVAREKLMPLWPEAGAGSDRC